MLELVNVTKSVGGQTHIHPTSLVLERGSLNVLLGPTLSGKTTLLRLMAGLEQPTSGEVRFDGKSVASVPVQKRNVAMVYQQFINYPSMTVYENIASPLRIAGESAEAIDAQVKQMAELMRLTPYLQRLPLSLSGGQQQRTALARAIVKKASLVLLDEPLANLDYKLREEMREELPKIFVASGSIFVYATTEPSEALLLGGNTATLHEGRVSQFGKTISVYRHPRDLTTAKTFADPPLNTITAHKQGDRFSLGGEGAASMLPVPAHLARIKDGPVTLAFQPHHLSLAAPFEGAPRLPVKTRISEIAGSESFIHITHDRSRWVMIAHGVCDLDPALDIDVFVDVRHLMAFGEDGRTLAADPASATQHGG
ncbi:ABC transporter ATP-binding protein [Aestuariivirga sp.]|uniref:ABC transporter ATP-binding protein n=1 Tax=Aestuariivirga sp. TaxID=2650926 RepID=UPI003BAAA091